MGKSYLAAIAATGEGVRMCLRPVGLSGLVTTPQTVYAGERATPTGLDPVGRSDARISAEKSGEPK